MVTRQPPEPSTSTTTLRVTLPPPEQPDAEPLLRALTHARDETVEAREAILMRCDGIPSTHWRGKAPCACATILAPQLEPQLLGALAELPDDVVDERLTRLVDMEVLSRTGAFPRTAAYAFRRREIWGAAQFSTFSTASVMSADFSLSATSPVYVQLRKDYGSAANRR